MPKFLFSSERFCSPCVTIVFVSRSSATGVEEALIVEFGQHWMKTTTNALAEKEDANPDEVTNHHSKLIRLLSQELVLQGIPLAEAKYVEGRNNPNQCITQQIRPVQKC